MKVVAQNARIRFICLLAPVIAFSAHIHVKVAELAPRVFLVPPRSVLCAQIPVLEIAVRMLNVKNASMAFTLIMATVSDA